MDLNALELRLENWARAQRAGGDRFSAAQSAESRYRAPGWRESNARPADIDMADAVLVNTAWQRLMPLDREVLRMHYVWRAPSSFICRRMKLKQGAEHAHVWEFALWHAQRAIDIRLSEMKDVVNPEKRAYNPPRLLNPA